MFLLMFVIWFFGLSRSFAYNICDSKFDSTSGCDMTFGDVVESFDSISSVGVCSLKCSETDRCISIKYDQINMVCQLNSEEYPLVSTNCPVKVRYAKLITNSCRKMINDACSATSECWVPNSQCFNNKCQCDPGYSYKMISESCLTSCDGYGSTFTLYTGYKISGYNNKVVENAVSGDVCKQACAAESSFVCRTVDYSPELDLCWLSVDTALTAPSSFLPDNTVYYYHRNCQ